jgi:hypothetical protein
VARRVLSRLSDEQALDIRTVDRHPLASVGSLVLGLPVLVVSGRRAYARADRIARCAVGPSFAGRAAVVVPMRCKAMLGTIGCHR